jgi:hypothetical protein
MPTGISLSASVLVGNNQPVDAKFGPYNSIETAKSDIPLSMRYKGLTVGIITNNSVKEYWFKDGIENANLIEKQLAGGGGSGGGSSVAVTPDPLRFIFTGDGARTDFAVSGTNGSTNPLSVEVYIDNVKQTSSNVYSLSSETVIFSTPPKVGSNIVIITPNYQATAGGTGLIIGSGVAEMKVVTEIPVSPSSTTIYVVIPLGATTASAVTLGTVSLLGSGSSQAKIRRSAWDAVNKYSYLGSAAANTDEGVAGWTITRIATTASGSASALTQTGAWTNRANLFP